jgi:SAM-dependent methyltransferase
MTRPADEAANDDAPSREASGAAPPHGADGRRGAAEGASMRVARAGEAEAQAVGERYARRDARADAARYNLFDAAALHAQQERVRALRALWRRHGWSSLAGKQVLEIGCGSGGNLLDLIRLGAEPARLTGLELLPDRLRAAADRLPAAVRLHGGDALHAPIEAASQDAVLLFTVFSSVLDDAVQAALADAAWRWVRPGGGVLCYDFAVDNPRNADVRGVPMARVRALFPQARVRAVRVTTLPPLARTLGRLHPGLIAWAHAVPLLRTHRLAWLVKA